MSLERSVTYFAQNQLVLGHRPGATRGGMSSDATRLRSAPGGRDAGTWWAGAALLFAAAFGTNVSTPLLLVYRERLDLSPAVLTAIFGVYALGLAPSLLLGGPASDRLGRTRVLLPAVALAGVASLLFLPGADSEPMLFVARFVQGLASGAAFSVGSAWLQDLTGADRPQLAARRASLALNIGFCLGPLSAGLLATYVVLPTTLPYLVHVGLVVVMLAVAVVVARGRDPWRGAPGAPGSRLLSRPGLVGPARRRFWRTLVPTAVCVYAFPSVAVTVLPLTLRREAHAVAFTGIVAAVALGAGAVVQPFARYAGRHIGPAGAALGTAGYGLGVAASLTQSLPYVLAGALLLGAGSGLCLNAGLVLVQQLSTVATRGALNGVFYAWAYVGFAAPLLCTAFVALDDLAEPLTALAVLAGLVSLALAAQPRGLPPANPSL